MLSWENMGLIIAKYSNSNEVRSPDFQSITCPCLDVFKRVASVPVSTAIISITEVGSFIIRDLFAYSFEG